MSGSATLLHSEEVEEVEEALECLEIDNDAIDLAAVDTPTIKSEENESELALKGMEILMNNDFKGAAEFFTKYSEESPVMDYGKCFVSFVLALISFEDAELSKALHMLKETSKRCKNTKQKKSWRQKLSKKSKSTKSTEEADDVDACERLERRIIMADCQLYSALLTFTGMDITSYMKGGWALRKAWKIYEKTYKQVQALINGNATELDVNLDVVDLDADESSDRLVEAASGDQQKSPSKKTTPNNFNRNTLERLYGAVSYGYGLLQLSISLTPPKILKLIELLGFEGDRQAGLAALSVSADSFDMRAPLAAMGLLWYHTMARSFLSLDGEDLQAGVEPGEKILSGQMARYPNSSLLLYYLGRIHRLKGEVGDAVSVYENAMQKGGDVRELQLMCVHEIGWCNMMKSNWTECLKAFIRLRSESKWSKSFYAYLCAICMGAQGDLKGACATMQEVPKLVKRKNSPIEQYVMHCAELFKKIKPSENTFRLFALEIVYLWNSLPLCSEEDIAIFQQVCDEVEEKLLFHHRSLFEGAICKLRGDRDLAKQFFEEAIARSGSRKEDRHIVAFATFEVGVLSLGSDTAEANKLLHKVKDMKDYEFDGRLSVRVSLLLKKLKLESKK